MFAINPYTFEFLSDIEKKRYIAQNLAGFGNTRRIKPSKDKNYADYALRLFPSSD